MRRDLPKNEITVFCSHHSIWLVTVIFLYVILSHVLDDLCCVDSSLFIIFNYVQSYITYGLHVVVLLFFFWSCICTPYTIKGELRKNRHIRRNCANIMCGVKYDSILIASLPTCLYIGIILLYVGNKRIIEIATISLLRVT
jgi:hypothetical protein